MIPPRNSRVRASRCKPRASGDDPALAGLDTPLVHVNPARAGMILVVLRALERPIRKPRASGDDPVLLGGVGVKPG